VNECKAVMTLDIIHESGHNLKVKYDWFSNVAEKETLNFSEVDTMLLKEWQVIKIEGEAEVIQPETLILKGKPTPSK
jgi:hypothetical protein